MVLAENFEGVVVGTQGGGGTTLLTLELWLGSESVFLGGIDGTRGNKGNWFREFKL